MKNQISILVLALGLALAFGLAACSSDGQKTKDAGRDGMVSTLSNAEMSVVLSAEGKNLNHLVRLVSQLIDERGARGEYVNAGAFASVLDKTFAIRCETICHVSKHQEAHQ